MEAIVGIESVQDGRHFRSDQGKSGERPQKVHCPENKSSKRPVDEANRTDEVQSGQGRAQLFHEVLYLRIYQRAGSTSHRNELGELL